MGGSETGAVPRASGGSDGARRRWPIVLLGVLAGRALEVFYRWPSYAPEAYAHRPVPRGARRNEESGDSRYLKFFPDAALPPDRTPTRRTKRSCRRHARTSTVGCAALAARGAGFGRRNVRGEACVPRVSGRTRCRNTSLASGKLADGASIDHGQRAPQGAATMWRRASRLAIGGASKKSANHGMRSARASILTYRTISDARRRTRSLTGVLHFLPTPEAESARTIRERAGLQPGTLARQGNEGAQRTARAHCFSGTTTYAKTVGSGFAALGAGRLGR